MMEDKRNFPRLGEIWDLAYRPISSEEFKEELLRAPVFPSSIIAVGKAVWCRKQEKKDKYDVGVEFQWMGWQDLDVQQALTEYITDHNL